MFLRQFQYSFGEVGNEIVPHNIIFAGLFATVLTNKVVNQSVTLTASNHPLRDRLYLVFLTDFPLPLLSKDDLSFTLRTRKVARSLLQLSHKTLLMLFDADIIRSGYLHSHLSTNLFVHTWIFQLVCFVTVENVFIRREAIRHHRLSASVPSA